MKSVEVGRSNKKGTKKGWVSSLWKAKEVAEARFLQKLAVTSIPRDSKFYVFF